MTDCLIDIRAVCATLGFSKSKVRDLINAGVLPGPLRLPHTRAARWRMSDVQAWIKEQTT